MSQANNQASQEIQGTIPNQEAPTEQIPTNGDSKPKRKATRERADIWIHFSKFTTNEGERKCKCIYCGQIYKCDPKTLGTSTYRGHLSRCTKYPYNGRDSKQRELNLQPSLKGQDGGGEKIGCLSTWKFDQELIRKALVYMIIVDELPFKFVEGQGFKFFCSQMQPRFHIPSRITVARDCYEMFVEERLKLKSFLKTNSKRICLTTDTWTSIQRINYMCLTCHFIDNDWKLNRRILNFCPISSHKGEAIGKAIEKCLLEWGIENVMTVTVDNASSNDVAVCYLKKRINNWKGSVLKGEYLHVRCVAHIMNLVVNDGLKLSNDSVCRVRNAVRYVRQSPSRLQKFKSCVEMEKIESKSLLCLDVPTRWNSTYMMLDAAIKFQKAFERFEEHDPFFSSELNQVDGREGKPRDEDWEKVKSLTELLENFYDLTKNVSGSLYVTSNVYFHEISNISCLLKEWCTSDNFDFSDMAMKMKEKCDKYWGKAEKLNILIFIPIVLDPRYKFEYLEFGISQMYDEDKGAAICKRVKDTMYALFDEYKKLDSSSNGQPTNSSLNENLKEINEGQPSQRNKSRMKCLFKKHRAEKDGGDHKSELDRYLEEEIEDDIISFDILEWWKISSSRFSILSQVARDVLAIPVSTVASESAFSTGGRVLDSFRSSLTPKIVEALICSQDWLRTASDPLNMEENLDVIEKLDTGMLLSL